MGESERIEAGPYRIVKRKDKLRNHIDKNTDNWSISSKNKLRASVRHKMKRIYCGFLDALDKELDDAKIDRKTLKRLRSCALNYGNDQIRNFETELDRSYNIEFINYHIEFRALGAGRDNEGR